MNQPVPSTNMELSLSRKKSLSLFKRLEKSSVSLNIKRGRMTARGLWLLIEIPGDDPSPDRADAFSPAQA